jgi:uncharacterized membrane protein YdjX (TVP38/TMEM64 family)
MVGFLRPMLPMILVLAVPLVPFGLFAWLSPGWEEQVAAWGRSQESRWLTGAVIVALLTSDIFLPIPSSVLCTAAGWQFGVVGGTLAGWVGMTLGAVLGFALARKVGHPAVAWLTTPKELARAGRLTEQFGPWLLAIARGIPVVAEASVLFVGLHQLPWRRFLPPVLVSNLALALVYAAFGQVAEKYQLLPLAIGVSVVAPVLMIAAFQTWLKGRSAPPER